MGIEQFKTDGSSELNKDIKNIQSTSISHNNSYTFSESDVVEILVDILESKFCTSKVGCEVPISRCTGDIVRQNHNQSTFITDVMVKSEEIAFECKGEKHHQQGIGQAISYSHHGYKSYLVGARLDTDIKEIICKHNIGGVNITNEGIEMINSNSDLTTQNGISRFQIDGPVDVSNDIEFIKNLRKEQRSLSRKMHLLKRQENNLNSNVQELKSRKEILDIQVELLNHEVNKLKSENSSLHHNNKKLISERDGLMDDIDKLNSKKEQISNNVNENLGDEIINKAAKFEIMKDRLSEEHFNNIEPNITSTDWLV